MFRSIMKGAVVGLALMMALGVCPSSGAENHSQETQPITGKKQAYMGDPTVHRGMELGWDRGYLAAKTDQKEGLAPEAGRHALYHDPQPMYRYEFGNRSYFYSGFRTGFLVGYRQGWDRIAPLLDTRAGENQGTAAGMEMEVKTPSVGLPTQPQGKKAQVQSDAL
jgi:hypothetical protein